VQRGIHFCLESGSRDASVCPLFRSGHLGLWSNSSVGKLSAHLWAMAARQYWLTERSNYSWIGSAKGLKQGVIRIPEETGSIRWNFPSSLFELLA